MSGGLEGIVPRWEWRTFAPRLGAAEARLAVLTAAEVERQVLRKLGCDALTVSDRGPRHGLLVEHFGRQAR